MPIGRGRGEAGFSTLPPPLRQPNRLTAPPDRIPKYAREMREYRDTFRSLRHSYSTTSSQGCHKRSSNRQPRKGSNKRQPALRATPPAPASNIVRCELASSV